MKETNTILGEPPKVGQEIQRLRLHHNLTLDQLASSQEFQNQSFPKLNVTEVTRL